LPNTSSTDDYYTDTIWLVVAIYDDERPPRLLEASHDKSKVDDIWSFQRSWWYSTESFRVMTIPFDLPLPVLVKNALEALDDAE